MLWLSVGVMASWLTSHAQRLSCHTQRDKRGADAPRGTRPILLDTRGRGGGAAERIAQSALSSRIQIQAEINFPRPLLWRSTAENKRLLFKNGARWCHHITAHAPAQPSVYEFFRAWQASKWSMSARSHLFYVHRSPGIYGQPENGLKFTGCL